MATLASLVQALPKELYDEIYELTFTTNSSIRHITERYQPPICLQVSRSTRETVAASYYGKDSIFYITKEDCRKWVASLPPSRFEMLRDVRILNLMVQPLTGVDGRGRDELADTFEMFVRHACDNAKPGADLVAADRIVARPRAFHFKLVRGGEAAWVAYSRELSSVEKTSAREFTGIFWL